MLSGYFSYDTIRYIEKIPNKCKDDLNLPDVRILRPRVLIIHDNLKKKIFFIINVFKDEKITNYKKKYSEIKKELISLNILAKTKVNYLNSKKETKKITVKSNMSKNKFLSIVNKAKKYIKIGDIFQVVLSQRFETKLTKKPIEIYKKLRKTNPKVEDANECTDTTGPPLFMKVPNWARTKAMLSNTIFHNLNMFRFF